MYRVLELFAGSEVISNEFKRRGCEYFTVDWDDIFPSSLHCDIENLKIEDLPKEFQHPDVVFMSPDPITYQLAAIRKHRKKNEETGSLDPVSEAAMKADRVNQHAIDLLKQLNPSVWWIETPRACFQKMEWMQEFEKYKHVITFCRYMSDLPLEARRQRPTNLWTNIPNPLLLDPCMRKAGCHPSTKRQTAIRGFDSKYKKIIRRSYPRLLIKSIVDITMDFLQEKEELQNGENT